MGVRHRDRHVLSGEHESIGSGLPDRACTREAWQEEKGQVTAHERRRRARSFPESDNKETGDEEEPEAIQAAEELAVAQPGEHGLLPFKDLPKITSTSITSTHS